MENDRIQFRLGGLLWAIFWIAIGLSTLPLVSNDFHRHLMDDDGDNVGPRLLILFWCALCVGVVSSLQGDPFRWVKRTLGFWLASAAIIIFVALM